MILLKNAKVYDGSGGQPFVADLLLDRDRISKIGQNLQEQADQMIDLKGKSVAPGFVDCHSHNDWFVIRNNPTPYFEPFIRQGITSFVTGNCGLSCIGFEDGSEHVDKVGGGLFGYRGDTRGVYPDAERFFGAVAEEAPCNIAVLAGHCSARASVSGYKNGKLSSQEEQRMLSVLEENLKQGAAGISLGLMYDPGVFADTEELKKVAQLCVKYDVPLTVHPRAESKVSMAYPELFGRSHLLRAFDELVEISRGTNLKLQYSHAIFVGRSSFADKDELLRMIDEIRSEGVRAQFDIYNEVRGVSVITVILPGWYKSLSEEERANPLTRLKLRLLVFATRKLLGFGFSDIEVAYIGPGYEQYEGKTVHELAKEYGKSDLDMYLQLCEQSNYEGRVNMGPYSTSEIIHEFERNPLCLYMTDAWVEPYGVPNPVLNDCFPKFLRDSVLGIGDTLPNTIRRMTGASCDRFRIPERGYIKEGYYADLTVFDENTLKTTDPCGKAFGVEQVFVNGKRILSDGILDEELARHSGMPIRIRNS